MPTTSTMQPAPSTPKPRKRWWLRGLLAFTTVAIVVPLGYFAYWTMATRSAWAEAEEEATRDDPRWRLMEIEADRPAVADPENGALMISAMVRVSGSVYVSGAPNYESIFRNLPANAQLNAQQVQIIRAEIAKIPRALDEARKLKDMPEGRFPLKYSDDWYSTSIGPHHETRIVTDWLKHDAMLLAQEGDCDAAMESCQAIINAGRAIKDDPFLITLLIRLALQSIALDSLERVLAQGEPSEDRLRRMQVMLEKEIDESNSFVLAVRGERAGGHHLFEGIRDGKIKASPVSVSRIRVWIQSMGGSRTAFLRRCSGTIPTTSEP